MYLAAEETALFYRLWFALLAYASLRYPEILPGVKTPDEIRAIPFEALRPLRDQVYRQPELFEAFAAENPERFTEDELAIVRE